MCSCRHGWQGVSGGLKALVHLKAPACIPELWSSMPIRSLGRAVSWFPGRIRSCRADSRWKALSSMEEKKFLERSVLFSFTEWCEGEQRDTGHTIFSCPWGSCHILLPPSQGKECQPVLHLHQVHTRRNNVINQDFLEKPSDSATPFPGVLSYVVVVHLGSFWKKHFKGKTQQARNQFLDPFHLHPPPLIYTKGPRSPESCGNWW